MSTDTVSAMARTTRRIALMCLALAVTGLVAGCSGDNGSATAKTTTTVAGQTSTTAAQAPATNAPSNTGGSTGSSTTAPPSGPAPVINTFVTPDNIDCHNGNSQTFSASWTTTNAVMVTISIDGAGVYKTYAPNASDSLPFNCSTSHSFLLTAYAQDGRTVSQTITLQPRNVQTSTPSST